MTACARSTGSGGRKRRIVFQALDKHRQLHEPPRREPIDRPVAFPGAPQRAIPVAMDLLVDARGWALWDGRRLRCALGRGGVRADKREGDGATPAGGWPMRRLLYRFDRVGMPTTRLAAAPIAPEDGWCDDPADPLYNRPVRLPYRARAEALWRQDNVYDLIVPLGYNDDPVVPGAGSAIFLHVARDGYAPTEGCVALADRDLLMVLAAADETSRVIVMALD